MVKKDKINTVISSSLRKLGPLFALLVIVIIISMASPVFLQLNNLMNIIVQVAVIAIIASGATFIILTGGIDLSVGAVMAFSGVLAAGVMRGTGSVFLAIVTCIGVSILFGVFTGVLVTFGKIPSFVATLGTMSIARGLSFVFTGGKPISGFPDSFRFMGAGSVFGIPMMFITTIILYILLNFVLKKTPFGRITLALGSNEEATKLTGIRTRKYKIYVYTLAGVLTGIASLMYLGRINSGHPNSGQGYELDAIAAVVIGGTSLSGGKGTILGTIIGALIMGVIRNGLNLLNIDPYFQSVVLGVVIILAVLIDQNSRKS